MALCLLALAACEDDVHKQIHGDIHVIVNRDDALVGRAVQSLAQQGTRALPQIETAMHAARPEGRLRLVEVGSRIRSPETVPLLRHIALYDADARVRQLAEATLVRWSTAADSPERQGAARTALQWLAAARTQGLGPLVRHE